MDEEQVVDKVDGVDVFGRRWELRVGLLQEDVERYTRAFNEVVPRPVGVGEQRSAELKAAIVAGWIVSPPCVAREEVDLAGGGRRRVYLFDGVEVGKMPARQVYHYARLVSRRYVEETEPADPNG